MVTLFRTRYPHTVREDHLFSYHGVWQLLSYHGVWTSVRHGHLIQNPISAHGERGSSSFDECWEAPAPLSEKILSYALSACAGFPGHLSCPFKYSSLPHAKHLSGLSSAPVWFFEGQGFVVYWVCDFSCEVVLDCVCSA